MKRYKYQEIMMGDPSCKPFSTEGADILYKRDSRIADPDGWYVKKHTVHVTEEIWKKHKDGNDLFGKIRIELEGEQNG